MLLFTYHYGGPTNGGVVTSQIANNSAEWVGSSMILDKIIPVYFITASVAERVRTLVSKIQPLVDEV